MSANVRSGRISSTSSRQHAGVEVGTYLGSAVLHHESERVEIECALQADRRRLPDGSPGLGYWSGTFAATYDLIPLVEARSPVRLELPDGATGDVIIKRYSAGGRWVK